jgi:hypothetical protein
MEFVPEGTPFVYGTTCYRSAALKTVSFLSNLAIHPPDCANVPDLMEYRYEESSGLGVKRQE